ncbi:MAG: C10 family peptidase [Bacteroidaceae bacterium]|nr:C10 family peptidase [Bacteroides sp.]MBQ4587796.1 C10 family peptidase [Bacteroidaceae bacterium]
MKTARFINAMFIMSLFIISCTENSIPEDIIVVNNTKTISVKPIKQGQADISLIDAQVIAQMHMKKQFKKDITPREISSRSGDNAIVTRTGKELAHIVNFQEGGYCIVSANKKNIPILAYSDHGIFDNDTEGNLGLEIWKEEIEMQFEKYEELSESEIAWINRQWMEYEDNDIEHSSRSNSEMNAAFNQQMALYNASTGRTAYPLNIAQNYLPSERYQHFKSIANSKNSPEEYTIIEIIDNSIDREEGPFLTTEWHQGSPYSDEIGITSTGCYPIAACQIMYFHKHPSSYNWNNMGDADIAHLIKDFREAAQMGNSTTVDDTDDVLDALENTFNYTAEIRDHEISDLFSYILNAKVPVILAGHESYSLITGYRNGHAWVCDGASYREERYAYRINWITLKDGKYVYDSDGIDYNEPGIPSIKFHYNWGWGYNNGNGWYIGNSNEPDVEDSCDFSVKRENIFMYPN